MKKQMALLAVICAFSISAHATGNDKNPCGNSGNNCNIGGNGVAGGQGGNGGVGFGGSSNAVNNNSNVATGGNSAAYGGSASAFGGVSNVDVDNRVSNNVSNTNLNANTNKVENSSLNVQGQTSEQAQKQNQSQNVKNSGNNTGTATVTVEGDNFEARRIPVNTAFAPSIAPTANCALSVSGGISTIAFSGSFGKAYIDQNCATNEDIRNVALVLGDKETAEQMKCITSETYRKARAAMNRHCAVEQE